MIRYDPLEYPYASQRKMVYAKNGMVGTSQPLAAQAGLETLKEGGNAVDAAIATASCLTVLEPTSNGLGGDAFVLFWKDGKLHGLNSSGPAPKNISIDAVKDRGYDEMPKTGIIPVTVPGIPGAWAELSKKHGKLGFEKVLEPAIKYAEEGYPISPIVGKYWNYAYKSYKKLEGEEFEHWFDTFAPDGRPPKIGETWMSPDHAETLRSIAETRSKSFYKGEIADKIDEFSKNYDGFLSKKDLSSFSPEWVEPLSINYRGYDVWELPPNGQGMIALMALNILKGFDFDEKDSIETYHKQMEALKLAFSDGKKHITDPEHMDVSFKELLSEDYAAERREMIDEKAIEPEPGKLRDSGTVYLTTADKDGNMVSYIQSNYMGFGSGLVVPNTGIALQNRGHTFSLDPNEANCLEAKKRTYHTIIPGFLTENEYPIGPFGVMGGYMQPQGHMQILMNSIDFDLNPQAALDAPRWRWESGKKVHLEHSFPKHIAEQLSGKGHALNYSLHSGGFGRGQIIWKKDDVYAGGTEPRADGQVVGW
ncbi:MAG: gamma-glutamyltransferase family protein [Candidatus Saliniplasma sp.]